jgi:hypothetical protein
MKATIRAFLLLVACVVVLGGLAAYASASRGLSTRVQPSVVEESIARTMRRLATPRGMREARNPGKVNRCRATNIRDEKI